MKKKVSILLSSYNHEKHLRQSIDSILSQGVEEYELVIVDDGSEDNSWQIIESYSDARIKKIRNPINTNWLFFTKDFVDTLEGDYIAIAHDDDYWLDGKLAKQLSFLDENSDYDLCFTQVQVVNEEGEEIQAPDNVFKKAFSTQNRSRQEWLGYMAFHNCPFCHPSALIRKSVFASPNMFPTALTAVPDYYKWITAALKHEIYIYPEPLTAFRVREKQGNTSGESFEKRNRQAYELWLSLHLYNQITDANELISVFPSAKKYLKANEMIVPFALARIMIDEGKTSIHRQFGLDILYHLVENRAGDLQRLYGYTAKEYARETGEWDIYGFVKPERFQESWLFLDFGQGFSDENVLRQKNYITEKGEFSLTFDLTGIAEGKTIKALRFDPDKNFFRKYRLDKVMADDHHVKAEPLGHETQNGWDHFYTLASAYSLSVPDEEIRVLTVEGCTETLSLYEVDEKFRSIRLQGEQLVGIKENDIAELRSANDQLWAEQGRLQAECDQLRADHEQLKIEQEQLQAAYVAEQNRLAALQSTEQELRKNHNQLASYLKNHRIKATVRAFLGLQMPGL